MVKAEDLELEQNELMNVAGDCESLSPATSINSFVRFTGFSRTAASIAQQLFSYTLMYFMQCTKYICNIKNINLEHKIFTYVNLKNLKEKKSSFSKQDHIVLKEWS